MTSTGTKDIDLPSTPSHPHPHPHPHPQQSQTKTQTSNVELSPTTTSVLPFSTNNTTSPLASQHPQSQIQTQQVPSAPSLTITSPSPTSSPTTADTSVLGLGKPIDPPSATTPTSATSDQVVEKGNQPTDSEGALLSKQPVSTINAAMTSDASSNGEPSKGSSLTNLTRRLSGRENGSKAAVVESSREKPSTSSTTQATSPSTTTPRSVPSTSKPAAATTSSQKISQKKKKKRKGLAGFLLTLGCLSADEFEDDPKTAKAREVTQKPGPSVTTGPAKTTAAPAVAPAVKPKTSEETPAISGLGHQADATGTTGSTLVDNAGEGDKTVDKPVEEVVVAPAEPHTLPVDETAGVTSSAVQPPGGGSSLLGTPTRSHPQRRDSDAAAPSTSADAERTDTSGGYTDISNSEVVDESSGAAHEEGVDEYGLEEEYEDEEDRLIEQGGMGIPVDENGRPAPLLPPIFKEHHGRKCLVLDLDETLLHSSFKSLPSADYIVPVEIESQIHNVYVIKRPGVDHFLKEMGKIYEIVVFTASLSKYADPVLDMLDVHRVVTHRLFRESCYNHKGNYVKDLSQLGRSIETSIIIDNSPASYIFHPNNAVPVSTWFNDPHDTELTDLCPFLTDLATVDDIRGVLDGRLL